MAVNSFILSYSLGPHVQNFCHIVYSERIGIRTSLVRMN